MTAIAFEKIKGDVSHKWSGIAESQFTSGNIPHSVKLEPFVVIEDDVIIGENTIIGPFTFLRNGTKIGSNSVIGGHCVSEGQDVKIGNNVRIGTHCNFGYGTVVEDMVFIAGHFTGANDNNIMYKRGKWVCDPYRIECGSRIGLGVIIGPGVVVKHETLVGMNSLVTNNTIPKSIYYGSPAKWHGYIEENEELINQ